MKEVSSKVQAADCISTGVKTSIKCRNESQQLQAGSRWTSMMASTPESVTKNTMPARMSNSRTFVDKTSSTGIRTEKCKVITAVVVRKLCKVNLWPYVHVARKLAKK